MSLPSLAHVVVSLAHGGLERLVVDWTNERNRRAPGSTRIVCLDEPGELAAHVAGDGVQSLGANRARSPWDRHAVARLRSLVTDERAGVDIVHSHNTAAQQYAGLAVRRTGIPHVHTEHGTNIHGKGLRNRLRNAVISRLTTRTVAVSEDTADALNRARIARRSAITVIPNGVRCPALAGGLRRGAQVSGVSGAEVRNELGISEGEAVIGSVGRLAAVKGYDRLLRAFASVPPSPPRAAAPVLLLVGDGPEREVLRAQAAELHIADRVRFAGYREDARALLSAMDLFILPSRSEGLSVALLEAMAEGVPVLATDVGENRRILDDGNCGVLLSDDEAEWGRIVCEQLALGRGQGGEVRERVDRARKRVETRYSLDATLEAYERVYRSVLG